MKRLLFAVLLMISFVAQSYADDYDGLVEKGEFFLEKGAAYTTDAIKSLEQAVEKDAARARGDARLVLAISRAYIGSQRLSEAYWFVDGFLRAGKPDPKIEAVKEKLLGESGVGRLKLVTFFPTTGLVAELSPTGETRLDVTGKKVLEKLNALLQTPFRLGAEGLTFLVPEGEYNFKINTQLGPNGGKGERKLELWAGDEVVQPLVARYPTNELVTVTPSNRAVSLKWPAVEGGKFKLVRKLKDKEPETVYEGDKPAFKDANLPVSVQVGYNLQTFGPNGELLAQTDFSATASPPVQSVLVEGRLSDDHSAEVTWSADDGTIDAMRILRVGDDGTKVLAEMKGAEIVRHGDLTDGPLPIGSKEKSFIYRVEAWVEGSDKVTGETSVSLPPQVSRIDAVSEKITQDEITVEWETFPKDGLADGFDVFVVKRPGAVGELVGHVKNPTARDFSYIPTDKSPSPARKHFVLPFLGERYLWVPEKIDVTTEENRLSFEERDKKSKRNPNVGFPDVVVSWKPYPDAKAYKVQIGDNEYIQTKDLGKDKFFIEIDKLQTDIVVGDYAIEVFAIMPDGKMERVLSMNLRYEPYGMERK